MRGIRLSYQQIIAMIYVAAMFMTIMDVTIVYVALPAIARSFSGQPGGDRRCRGRLPREPRDLDPRLRVGG